MSDKNTYKSVIPDKFCYMCMQNKKGRRLKQHNYVEICRIPVRLYSLAVRAYGGMGCL